jgi:hypothetical protein
VRMDLQVQVGQELNLHPLIVHAAGPWGPSPPARP